MQVLLSLAFKGVAIHSTRLGSNVGTFTYFRLTKCIEMPLIHHTLMQKAIESYSLLFKNNEVNI